MSMKFKDVSNIVHGRNAENQHAVQIKVLQLIVSQMIQLSVEPSEVHIAYCVVDMKKVTLSQIV